MARAKKQTAKQIEAAKAKAAEAKAKAPAKSRKAAVEVEVSVAPPKKKADKVVTAEKVKAPSAAELRVQEFGKVVAKWSKDTLEARHKELNRLYVKALKAKESTDEIRYETVAIRRLLGFTTYVTAR